MPGDLHLLFLTPTLASDVGDMAKLAARACVVASVVFVGLPILAFALINTFRLKTIQSDRHWLSHLEGVPVVICTAAGIAWLVVGNLGLLFLKWMHGMGPVDEQQPLPLATVLAVEGIAILLLGLGAVIAIALIYLAHVDEESDDASHAIYTCAFLNSVLVLLPVVLVIWSIIG